MNLFWSQYEPVHLIFSKSGLNWLKLLRTEFIFKWTISTLVHNLEDLNLKMK